jgi:hypothetical protein
VDKVPSERVRLIACGAIAREILAVLDANGLGHVDVACLPALLHNHPQKIAPAVEDAIGRARAAGYGTIAVAYADCGTGGLLDAVCERHGVTRIAGPHCFSFFGGNERFLAEADANMRTFWLTDFFVRQFEAFFAKPFKLDRHPEMRDMLFGHYERCVYLAQTNDPALDAKAEAIAARLKLAYERRATGYGDLAPALSQMAGRGRMSARDDTPPGKGGPFTQSS